MLNAFRLFFDFLKSGGLRVEMMNGEKVTSQNDHNAKDRFNNTSGFGSSMGTSQQARVCNSWNKNQSCKFGDRCKYNHTLPSTTSSTTTTTSASIATTTTAPALTPEQTALNVEKMRLQQELQDQIDAAQQKEREKRTQKMFDEQKKKDDLREINNIKMNYEEMNEDENIRGVILVCKTNDRYGFIGRDILQKNGTYFQFSSCLEPQKGKSESSEGDDVQKVQPKKKLTLQQQIEMRQNKYRNKRNGPVHATNEQNNSMTRGDVVTYDVVHDRRTGKLRCHNIRVLVDEENIMLTQKKERMEMNRLKLLEKQKKEAERLIKQQAQQEQNRIHNKGFDRSRSKLNFNSQEESNAERKKYLKER